MPYSHITRTAFGADAIEYARGNGKGHNDNEVRNEYIGCVNMLPDSVVPFEKQMQPFWDKADSRHTTQINRLIVSFARSELDPDKPENGPKALAIGRKIAKKNASDNQSIVYVQKDGKSGLWHLHILTNDVNISDYRGINPLAYAHFHVQKIVDEVCQEYFDLAEPEAQPEKVNPSVRGARIKNEQIRAANELEKKRAAEEGREVDPDKIMAERYIWQDDLRQRVKEAAARATDESDFAHQLRLSGVELVPHEHKDGTVTYLHPATKKQPPHYTYELVDTSGFPDKIPSNLKSKSHKLGTNYQPEGVAKLFTGPGLAAQEERKEQAPPVILETPVPVHSPSKKPAQKPTATTEKPSEDKEMEDARKQAADYALHIIRQTYGWDATPKMVGPDGKEKHDFKEWDRQFQERDTTFGQFTRWRVDRRKEGVKLPPIYVKDKATGHISLQRDELEAQFKDFLDRRDHPEKYQTPKEPPQTVEKPQEEQEQAQHQEYQPKQQERREEQTQETPTHPSTADQERQKIAAQHSILWAELQRINAANERRWQEQEQDGEEDTIVKS